MAGNSVSNFVSGIISGEQQVVSAVSQIPTDVSYAVGALASRVAPAVQAIEQIPSSILSQPSQAVQQATQNASTVSSVQNLPTPYVSKQITPTEAAINNLSTPYVSKPSQGGAFASEESKFGGDGNIIDQLSTGLFNTLSSNIITKTVLSPILPSVQKGIEAYKAYEGYQTATPETVSSSLSKYQSVAKEITPSAVTSVEAGGGIGSWIGGVKSGYESLVKPINEWAVSTLPSVGIIKSSGLVTGITSLPSMALFTGQAVATDVESALKSTDILSDIEKFPALATAGTLITARSMYDTLTTNPVELGTSLIGTYLGMRAISGSATKAVGLARTSGLNEYGVPKSVSVESIGYDSRYGYPIKPTYGTSTQLYKSFEEGTLIPTPKEMSATQPVIRSPLTSSFPYVRSPITMERIEPPYVPKSARLPTHEPGDIVLWTAHEAESLTKGIKVGEGFKMVGTGSSELNAISAAPVLESYYTKAGLGGQIPESIGFESPFKSPTAYATEVPSLETIPSRVKKMIGKTPEGGTDYTPLNQYMAKRLTEVPAGQAFIPMIKGEYEANIPTNTLFEVTGRRYYTKVGGIGESHLFGTRVPIIELKTTGYEPSELPESASPIKTRIASSSYKAEPLINLAYTPLTTSIVKLPSSQKLTEKLSTIESKVSEGISKVSSALSSERPLSESLSKSLSKSLSGIESGISSKISLAETISLPLTKLTPPTPPTTPPYSPSEPVSEPKTIKTPPSSLSLSISTGGGVSSTIQKKRRKVHEEVFSLGTLVLPQIKNVKINYKSPSGIQNINMSPINKKGGSLIPIPKPIQRKQPANYGPKIPEPLYRGSNTTKINQRINVKQKTPSIPKNHIINSYIPKNTVHHNGGSGTGNHIPTNNLPKEARVSGSKKKSLYSTNLRSALY